MAFDFNLIANLLGAGAGVAGTMVGGPLGAAAGTLLPGVFQGLGDAFGLTDGSESAQRAQQQADIDTLANLQQRASFNAAGAEGADANRQAAAKAAELINTQSADSRLAQQEQRALASSAMAGGQQMMNAGRTMAMQNLGNQNRSLLEQARAGGASAAALAGISGNLGAANTQTMANMMGQGNQALMAGMSQAGQNLAAAEQGRMQDMQNRLQMFQPYAIQKFAPTSAQGLGAMGQYGESTASQIAAEDPLALLKGIGGQAAGGNLNYVGMDRLAEMLRRQGRGVQ